MTALHDWDLARRAWGCFTSSTASLGEFLSQPCLVRWVFQEAFKAREAEMMARSEAAWKQYQEQRGE
jgi:hypothetical protein